MKPQKFDAKSFLKAKTLSPLEQNQVRGGLDTVRVVQVKQVQQVVVRQVVVIGF